MRTPYVSYVLLSKIILLSFCSFYLKLESLYVRNIEAVLVAVVIIAPRAMLPKAFDDIGHTLLELRVSILRCKFACQLTIHDITATLYYHTTALEVFRAAVLLLILALRVCAHLQYCY